MKAALTRPNNKTGLCITHCKRFRLYWWIGKAIFIICALRKQKKVGEIIAIKMEIKGMNTANRLCYHSRADSREVTVAHLRFDSSCIRWDFQRGVPLFGEVENRIVAAECEFNSAFTICTTCFWISWQKSNFPKEKKIEIQIMQEKCHSQACYLSIYLPFTVVLTRHVKGKFKSHQSLLFSTRARYRLT